jgi:hypothetical protein
MGAFQVGKEIRPNRAQLGFAIPFLVQHGDLVDGKSVPVHIESLSLGYTVDGVAIEEQAGIACLRRVDE